MWVLCVKWCKHQAFYAVLLSLTLQIFTNFPNTFTVRLNGRFLIKSSPEISAHLKRVTTLPCETSDDSQWRSFFVSPCVCVRVVDWRLSPLVQFVKHWAKVQGINDASQGTVSSYSLVLLVIHYLQCKPRVSFLGRLLWVGVITLEMSVSRYVHLFVHTYVRPSVHKKFFQFQWNLVFR